MIVPYHPGDRWCDPDVQAGRRAEIEKQQREIAAYHERAARDQEERLNREERERLAGHDSGIACKSFYAPEDHPTPKRHRGA
jgi:hypothetical protein